MKELRHHVAKLASFTCGNRPKYYYVVVLERNVCVPLDSIRRVYAQITLSLIYTFNDLSCYAEQLFKWGMKRKVIFDYTGHRLVFNALVLNRSATLITSCSFNIIGLRRIVSILRIAVTIGRRIYHCWIYQRVGLVEYSSTCPHLCFSLP